MSIEPQNVTPEPPPRGWFSRNWLWFVPSMIALLCICPVGCCGGGFWMLFVGPKSSEPYQMALLKVKQDPTVIERLGEPLTDAFAVSNQSISVNADGSGAAHFEFTISGPKGPAKVQTEATRADGIWTTDKLRVVFDIGDEIDLAQPAAPPFDQ
jgi:hypothetical protein